MMEEYINQLFYEEDKEDVRQNGEHTTKGGHANWVTRVYICSKCGGPTEERKVGLTYSIKRKQWKRGKPYCNKCAREVIVKGSKNYCKNKGIIMPAMYIKSLYDEEDREYVMKHGERTTDGYDSEGKQIIVKRRYVCVRCGAPTVPRSVRNVWVMRDQTWRAGGPLCPECIAKSSYESVFENEVREYIKSIYHGRVQKVRGIIKAPSGHPMELDIYLPELGLAVECNGEVWHRESGSSDEYGRVKFEGYHTYKEEKCREQGIDLVTIWYRDWCKDKAVVKDKLKTVIDTRGQIVYG